MTPEERLQFELRRPAFNRADTNARRNRIADLSELLSAEDATPRKRNYTTSPAVTLEQAAQIAAAKVAAYEAHVAGLSAETQETIEMTRKAWNNTAVEAY